MKQLFSLDSPIIKRLSLLSDLFLLNILFIFSSVTLITVGASLTALNSSWQRIIRGRGDGITSYYFKKFRENFKSATIVWFILVVLGLVGIVDYNFFSHQEGFIKWLGLFVLVIAIVLWLLILSVTFSYLGRYTGGTKESIKNSILLALYNPRQMWMLLLIHVLVIYASVSTPVRLLTAIYVFTFCGFSVLSYVNARILKTMFDKVEIKK